jgi:hypothetical protein
MKLKGTRGMRIVDMKTNDDIGVFDRSLRPLIKTEYIKKRLVECRESKSREVK